jgi:RES domain-containing protein
MRAFRFSPKVQPATAFSGEGARLAGGRWNHKGERIVYCSESRALAAMEYFVNVDFSVATLELVFVAVDVPADLITAVDIETLPAGWRSYPAPDALKDIGAAWVRKGKTAALLVPSAVIPEEHNLLLNPEHAAFSRIKIGKAQKFSFAARLEIEVPLDGRS